MKLRYIGAIATLALVASTQAGVILGTNIQGGTGDTLIAKSSNQLMSGGIAASGYFNAGFDVGAAVAAQDYAGLASAFNILTSSAIGETSADFGTDIAGFYSNPSVDYGAPGARLGAQLYTFFGNGGTLGGSSQFGLVSFGATIDADSPAPDSNNLNLFTGATYTVLLGTTGGTATVNLSGIGQGEAVVNPTLQLVPEPSAALLGLLGAVGLIRRRR